MRIAIGGSRGFIGSALAASLNEMGHELHPIVRREPRAGEIGIDLISRTLDCSRIEGGSIGAVDIVYNLAGEPLSPRRWDSEKREAIRSSRITSTDVIARAIAGSSRAPRALVAMSASGYYGSRGDELLTEKSGSGEGFLAELCRAWEAATAPARAVGVRVVHARTGIVIGKGGGIMKTLVPIFRLGLGGQLGSGDQWMSHIALADEVKALIYVAMDDDIHGACNFTSPMPVRNTAFTKALGSVLRRPTPFRIPELALGIALGRRTADEMVLASQRIMPARLLEAGFKFDLPDVTDAFRSSI